MKTTLLTETHPTLSGTLVRALLRIEGEPPADARRVPLNLALVLDRSGSMGYGKLEAVKEAARGLIRRLHPEDVVSVVAFDDQVVTVAHPGTARDQTALVNALMAIQSGSTTNLSGGWLQGRALLQEHFDPEGVNRVILLTDGLANQGITDGATLARLTAQARTEGVTTTTVGVGDGFNEDLLMAMADSGGGSSYYIERLDQAGGIFEEEVAGLLSIAAQNLTVTVRPREAASVSAVYNQYPSHETPDHALVLSVGDLYAREPREVLADFLVEGVTVASSSSGAGGAASVDEGSAEAGGDGMAGPAGAPVADLVLEADTWTDAGSMERQRITLPITFDPRAGAVSHAEVERVFVLLKAARARREAVERGDRGDVRGAARSLRDAANLLMATAPNDLTVREEIQDLGRVAQSLEEQDIMDAADRKYMASKAAHYSRSRRSAGGRTTRE